MERKKLPNATAVLVLGILSIILCWCYGVIGVICGGIALYLAAQDMKLYKEEPEAYINYQNLNIGRILAIIGLVISTIYMIFTIYMLVVIGEDGMKSFIENLEAKQEQMESVD